MSQLKAILLLVFFTSFWFSGTTFAQSYNATIRTINVVDGLSDQNITCVLRTQDHSLWIGTEDGLNRFNGFAIKEYNSLNSVLTRNGITALRVDGGGALWVVLKMLWFETDYEGPFRYNPESDDFEDWSSIYGDFPFQSSGWFRNIFFQEDNVYFLNETGGYWLFNTTTRLWSEKSTAQSMNVMGMVDGFWIYEKFDLLKLAVSKEPTKLIDIETFKTNSGFLHFLKNLDKRTLDEFENPSPAGYDSTPHILWITDKNNLYGISDSGAFIRFQNNQNHLTFNRNIRDVFIDDGVLYLGTEDGVLIIKTSLSLFRNYFSNTRQNPEIASLNPSRGIVVDETFIYTTLQDGLYREPLSKSEPAEILIHDGLFPVIFLSDSSLLTGKRSLYRYHRLSGKTETLVDENNPFLLSVWSLQASPQHLYLGGYQGLNIYPSEVLDDGSLSRRIENETILPDKFVYQTLLTNAGQLMIATDQGLFLSEANGQYVDAITFNTGQNQKAKFEKFAHVLKDGDNTWWAATLDEGIIHFSLEGRRATVLNQLSRSEGLPTNTCYAVYKDESGNVWSSTDLGIVQLFTNTWTYTFYTPEDGFENEEFNRISHFQDAHGNIFFGGLNGVTCITPSDFESVPNTDIPFRILRYVQFSSWKDTLIDRTKALQKKHVILLRPGDSFFEIEVGLDDYFKTESHQYEYRLADLNGDWLIMNKNKLRVYSLPYGQHTLELRGKNGDGIYSQHIIKLSVRVLRPFYLRWWFYALVALGIFLVFREYLQSRAKRIQLLESSVRERTKKIEEQSEALRISNEARSRFFANISHELRTPLTLIKAPLQGLLSGKMTDDDAKKYMQVIDQNAETLADRIDDLLLLARADAQHLEVRNDRLLPNSFFGKITDYFSTLAKEKSIQLDFKTTMDPSAYIITDTKKVEHIISNFLSNAVKFTPVHGHIVVSCKQDKANINISVRDNGPGLSDVDCSQIFERFYQADKNPDNSSGTGIGLSLSKDFAEILGGTVGVISKESVGSTFFLNIPFVPASEISGYSDTAESEDKLSVPFPVQQLSEDPHSPLFRILLVEDHTTMREFLAHELLAYSVIQSRNGKEALDMLSSMMIDDNLPDLIISDVMMPVMDGFEMLREIKSHERLGAIPVIMLTARSGIEDKLEALRIGVDDYIAKPFDMRELVTRIENIASRKSEKQDTSEDTETLSVDQQWLHALEEQVKKHISDSRFTIDQLAQTLHISRRQLYRKVKSYTGLTANMYVREVRLFEARKLLESRSIATVSELAYQVGFEDPDYFSRIFAERFGRRPSSYL